MGTTTDCVDRPCGRLLRRLADREGAPVRYGDLVHGVRSTLGAWALRKARLLGKSDHRQGAHGKEGRRQADPDCAGTGPSGERNVFSKEREHLGRRALPLPTSPRMNVVPTRKPSRGVWSATSINRPLQFPGSWRLQSPTMNSPPACSWQFPRSCLWRESPGQRGDSTALMRATSTPGPTPGNASSPGGSSSAECALSNSPFPW